MDNGTNSGDGVGGGSGEKPSHRLPLSDVVSDCLRRWFQDTLKEAKAGDLSMQVLVALMYFNGYGIPKETQKAASYKLHIPVFTNLVKFPIGLDHTCGWYILSRLLESMPHLEHITFLDEKKKVAPVKRPEVKNHHSFSHFTATHQVTMGGEHNILSFVRNLAGS